jgi:DNA-3-methyladenine glycosylase II
LTRRSPSAVPGTPVPPRQLDLVTLRFATEQLARSDADLAGIVRELGPPPFWGRRPGFATLVRIILEQQVSLASARSMFERLTGTVGAVTPETVGRLGASGLRRLGFTGQKAAYCSGLADAIRRGALDLGVIARSGDDAGRRALLQVRGLGPWSVDVYYLIALRRPDVWPRGDLALADAVHRVKRLRARPDHLRLSRMAERWAPWRSVAARILWHHYLSQRKLPTD